MAIQDWIPSRLKGTFQKVFNIGEKGHQTSLEEIDGKLHGRNKGRNSFELIPRKGETWSTSSFTITAERPFVEYIDGKFVLIPSDAGTIYHTSDDGETWKEEEGTSVTGGIKEIAYGNGVAVCASENEGILQFSYSHNGFTWTNTNPGIVPDNGVINDITFVNGYFIACGYTGDEPICYYSRNGISWFDCYPLTGNDEPLAAGYMGGDFVIIFNDHSSTNLQYAVSTNITDDSSWGSGDTGIQVSGIMNLSIITFGKKMIAYGSGASTNTIFYIGVADLTLRTTWTSTGFVPTMKFSRWYDAIYANGELILVGKGVVARDPIMVKCSNLGETLVTSDWVELYNYEVEDQYLSITYGNGRFIATRLDKLNSKYVIMLSNTIDYSPGVYERSVMSVPSPKELNLVGTSGHKTKAFSAEVIKEMIQIYAPQSFISIPHKFTDRSGSFPRNSFQGFTFTNSIGFASAGSNPNFAVCPVLELHNTFFVVNNRATDNFLCYTIVKIVQSSNPLVLSSGLLWQTGAEGFYPGVTLLSNGDIAIVSAADSTDSYNQFLDIVKVISSGLGIHRVIEKHIFNPNPGSISRYNAICALNDEFIIVTQNGGASTANPLEAWSFKNNGTPIKPKTTIRDSLGAYRGFSYISAITNIHNKVVVSYSIRVSTSGNVNNQYNVCTLVLNPETMKVEGYENIIVNGSSTGILGRHIKISSFRNGNILLAYQEVDAIPDGNTGVIGSILNSYGKFLSSINPLYATPDIGDENDPDSLLNTISMSLDSNDNIAYVANVEATNTLYTGIAGASGDCAYIHSLTASPNTSVVKTVGLSHHPKGGCPALIVGRADNTLEIAAYPGTPPE